VDVASAWLWLRDGVPMGDVVTMLQVRRRFQIPDKLCSARAHEIAFTAQRMPVPVLRRVFREKFLAGLRQLYRKDRLDCGGPAADFRDPAWFEDLATKLGKKKWFVYAKPPFGGPAHVLRYLGRYTHRMAISNHRITAFDGERVSFRWRDYAHGGKQRIMTLDAVNFLCRFFLHVLPKGFVRIRHYGLLSNRFRKQLLPLARTLLAALGRQPLPPPPMPESDLWHCPRCGKPCGSSNASPPRNSISLASTLHERLPKSAPPACSTHARAEVCEQHAPKLENQSPRQLPTARSQLPIPPHDCF